MIYMDLRLKTSEEDLDELLEVLEILLELSPRDLAVRLELTAGLERCSISTRARLATLREVLGPRLRLHTTEDL
jgi:hypothetical protein